MLVLCFTKTCFCSFRPCIIIQSLFSNTEPPDYFDPYLIKFRNFSNSPVYYDPLPVHMALESTGLIPDVMTPFLIPLLVVSQE